MNQAQIKEKILWWNKFLMLIKDRGITGSIHGIVHLLAIEFYALSERRFDRHFNIDTSAIVRIEHYDDLDDQKKSSAVRYQATPIKALKIILQALDIDHPKYTFIDFGSGKGRVLLFASEYPFKRIIGVELSQHLHHIAQTNFRNWRNPKQRCYNLESICLDACDFRIPDDPLVLFFFTPFSASILEKVIENVDDSLTKNSRPVHIIYFGSNQDLIDVFKTLSFSYRQIMEPLPFLNYGAFLFSSSAKGQ
jgi:SAM-dependent methyltransferase